MGWCDGALDRVRPMRLCACGADPVSSIYNEDNTPAGDFCEKCWREYLANLRTEEK